MTVPGVGPIVSLAYASTIDIPSRFHHSRSVGAIGWLNHLYFLPTHVGKKLDAVMETSLHCNYGHFKKCSSHQLLKTPGLYQTQRNGQL
jgi:hypothetical protein